jgi:hypothetical protein
VQSSGNNVSSNPLNRCLSKKIAGSQKEFGPGIRREKLLIGFGAPDFCLSPHQIN